jgi:hypothetical protein
MINHDGSQPPCSPLDDVVGESGLGLAVNDRVSKVDQQQPHSQHIRPRRRRQVGNHVTLEPAVAAVVTAEGNVKLLADCNDTPVHRKVHSWMGIGSGSNRKQMLSDVVQNESPESGSAASNSQPISAKPVDNDTSIKVESQVLVDDATALLSSVGASTPRLPPTLPTVSILKTRPKYSKPLGTTSESVHEQSKLVDGEFNSPRVDPLVHVSTEPELHRETNAGLVRDLVLERPQRGPTPRLPQDSYSPLAVNSVEGYVPRTDQSNRAAAVAYSYARPAAEPKAPEALVGDDTSTAPPTEAAVDAIPVHSIRKRGAKSSHGGRSATPSAQTSLVATPATPDEANASDEVPLVFSSLADLMEKAGTLPDQNDGQPQVVEADVAFRCYDPDDYIGRVAQDEVLAKVEQYHQNRTTDPQTPANVRQERLVEDSEDDDPSTSSRDSESDDESQGGVGGLMDLMDESDDERPPAQPAERVFLQLWRALTHWITPLSVKYVQFLERGHSPENTVSSTSERIVVNESWEDGQWNWQAEINGDTRSVDRSGMSFYQRDRELPLPYSY